MTKEAWCSIYRLFIAGQSHPLTSQCLSFCVQRYASADALAHFEFDSEHMGPGSWAIDSLTASIGPRIAANAVLLGVE